VRVLVVRAGGALEPAAPELVTAEGVGLDSVDLTFRTPSFRADGAVPLANLDAVRIYRDGAFRREIPLFPGDTGRTITIRDAVPERGYYRYHITALDTMDPQNESPSSDTLVAYAGSTDPYTVTFDGEFAPRFLYGGGWALTSAVALTPPRSLTDSPDSLYGPRTNATAQIFPVRRDLYTVLAFDHIAIVDPSDSAIVEYRYQDDTTWTLLRSFNWNQNPQWSDSSADAGDWRTEALAIPAGDAADTVVTVRFRMKTNIFRHADGWYLDNVRWEVSSGIADELASSDGRVSVRPNPFMRAAVIDYALPRAGVATLRIVDLVGREVRTVDLGVREPGRHAYTLDASELAPGAYLFEITSAGGRVAGYLVRNVE
jgi:hypothetical protein